MNRNQPVHEFELGVVKAEIWANPTDSETYYNVVFTRVFHNLTGREFLDCFGRHDLPLLAKAVEEAIQWMNNPAHQVTNE